MSTDSIHVTAQTFETEVLGATTPVVLDFWAPWCGPCRQLAPVLDELVAQYGGKIKLAKINIEEEPELAAAMHIRGVPTLITVEKGRVTGQMLGFGGKNRLETMWRELADRAGAG